MPEVVCIGIIFDNLFSWETYAITVALEAHLSIHHPEGQVWITPRMQFQLNLTLLTPTPQNLDVFSYFMGLALKGFALRKWCTRFFKVSFFVCLFVFCFGFCFVLFFSAEHAKGLRAAATVASLTRKSYWCYQRDANNLTIE